MRSTLLLAAAVMSATAAAHRVTTPGDTYVATRYRGCGVAPAIAPGLTITGPDDTIVTRATATFTAGSAPAEDVLLVDPDPTIECSWRRTCSPCYPLTVDPYDVSVGLRIWGPGSRDQFQSCLRRVVYSNTAYGGTETLGRRTVTFTVTAYENNDTSTLTTSSADGFVQVLERDDATCSALLTIYAMTVDNPGGSETYEAGCSATCADNYAMVAPGLSITEPNAPPGEGFVQYAVAKFDPCTKRGGCPGTYSPDQDYLAVFPDPSIPGSTTEYPCPGLLVRPHSDDAGVYNGINITTPGTPEAYTACLRRLYYYNTASDLLLPVVPGDRYISLVLGGPVTATGGTFNGRTLVVPVDPTATCSGCHPTRRPERIGLPMPTPTRSALPSPSGLRSSGASALHGSLAFAALAVAAASALAVFRASSKREEA